MAQSLGFLVEEDLGIESLHTVVLMRYFGLPKGTAHGNCGCPVAGFSWNVCRLGI